MSVASSRGSTYSETFDEPHPTSRSTSGMWHPEKNLVTMTSLDLSSRERQRRDSISTNASNSTLAMDVPHDIVHDELDLKTPTVQQIPLDHSVSSLSDCTSSEQHQISPSHVAGPMEQLLQSLLYKVSEAESGRPTIMADDYAKLQSRIDTLEAEKKTWERRYKAYFEVRDEDFTNILKLRTMLAEERREHSAIRKLRDEDLENLLAVREKLAQALWSKPQPPPALRRTSTFSARQSRSEGDDLWQAAKSAAMEQRILELESANKELQEHATTKGGVSADVNTMMTRMETMFDESMKHREKMTSKMQQLRSEKEALQKEVGALEDRNAELETVIGRMQRNLGI